jgi:spore protease
MDVFARAADELAAAIRSMLEKKRVAPGDPVMVVGLGNRAVTPDSLGPKVVEKTLVTRHLHEYLPEQVDERMRPVCAFAPGVLGITGMETGEMVRGVLEKIKPRLVVAIDALASRSTGRISTTFQLADTGIHPGSGIGNRRMRLDEETLGVPVVALGVPLVVHASTLSRDAVSLLLSHTRAAESDEDSEEEDRLLSLMDELVSEKIGPLIVTPKEIDAIVSDCSSLVARAVNLALHELDLFEIERMMA